MKNKTDYWIIAGIIVFTIIVLTVVVNLHKEKIVSPVPTPTEHQQWPVDHDPKG